MILVLGSNGQLGTDITKTLDLNKEKYFCLDREKLDVSDLKSLDILQSYEFDYLINCTSYHKTDEVESNANLAFKVNSFAVKKIAEICKLKNACFIHISTDYVHGGEKLNSPISEEQTPSPLNIYGSSKALGEKFITLSGCKNYILRVSSLFGIAGASGKGGNFVEAIYKKAINDGELSVVCDQIMSPTSTKFISEVIVRLMKLMPEFGIYNVSNKGEVSWYDFAIMICKLCKINVKSKKIKSKDLNLPAVRPSYSVLDTKKIESIGIEIKDYKEVLKDYLLEKKYIS